jgi:hypothetical protein
VGVREREREREREKPRERKKEQRERALKETQRWSKRKSSEIILRRAVIENN